MSFLIKHLKNNSNYPFNDLHQIWTQTFGSKWPISINKFREILKSGDKIDDNIFLAKKSNKEILGFSSIKFKNKKAQLVCIVILPEYQQEGIGSMLMKEIFTFLKENGVDKLEIATGVDSYFWPGIPIENEAAIKFFKKHNFKQEEETVDLIQDISRFDIDNRIVDKVLKNGFTISLLTKNKISKLLDFENKHFPQWHKFFERKVNKNQLDHILISQNSRNKISGSMIILNNKDIRWNKCFEDSAGGFGALGVRKHSRSRGIGLAMSSKATHLLKERGIKYSFLGWTYLSDWYGKIGYKIWERYVKGKIKV